MERISVSDLDLIAAQIGRRPRGVTGIPIRCSYGYPQVVRVRPLIDGEPFPTLYWLTCPHLCREIDRLEADGWVGRLERRIAADDALGRGMEEAHRRYVEQRAAQLTGDDRRALDERGQSESLLVKGIGGIADRKRLKCLHLHVAHALGDANPIGDLVLEMLPTTECSPEQVICSALLEDGADRDGRIDR